LPSRKPVTCVDWQIDRGPEYEKSMELTDSAACGDTVPESGRVSAYRCRLSLAGRATGVDTGSRWKLASAFSVSRSLRVCGKLRHYRSDAASRWPPVGSESPGFRQLALRPNSAPGRPLLSCGRTSCDVYPLRL